MQCQHSYLEAGPWTRSFYFTVYSPLLPRFLSWVACRHVRHRRPPIHTHIPFKSAPGSSFESTKLVIDKYWMQAVMDPQRSGTDGVHKYQEVVQRISFPVVLMESRMADPIGVSCCNAPGVHARRSYGHSRPRMAIIKICPSAAMLQKGLLFLRCLQDSRGGGGRVVESTSGHLHGGPSTG